MGEWIIEHQGTVIYVVLAITGIFIWVVIRFIPGEPRQRADSVPGARSSDGAIPSPDLRTPDAIGAEVSSMQTASSPIPQETPASKAVLTAHIPMLVWVMIVSYWAPPVVLVVIGEFTPLRLLFRLVLAVVFTVIAVKREPWVRRFIIGLITVGLVLTAVVALTGGDNAAKASVVVSCALLYAVVHSKRIPEYYGSGDFVTQELKSDPTFNPYRPPS